MTKEQKLQATVTVSIDLTVRYEDRGEYENFPKTDEEKKEWASELALSFLPQSGLILVPDTDEELDAEVWLNIGIEAPEVELEDPDF